MSKLLVSLDYTEIMLDIFRQSPEDLLPFYLNILEQHYQSNPNLIDRIIKEVAFYYNIYSKVDSRDIGSIEYKIIDPDKLYYKIDESSVFVDYDLVTDKLEVFIFKLFPNNNLPSKICLPDLDCESCEFIEDYFTFHFKTLNIVKYYINLNEKILHKYYLNGGANRLDCYEFNPNKLMLKYVNYLYSYPLEKKCYEEFLLFSLPYNVTKDNFFEIRWVEYLIKNVNEIVINDNTVLLTDTIRQNLIYWLYGINSIEDFEINEIPVTKVVVEISYVDNDFYKDVSKHRPTSFRVGELLLNMIIIPLFKSNEFNMDPDFSAIFQMLNKIDRRILNNESNSKDICTNEIIIYRSLLSSEITKFDFITDELAYCNKLLKKINSLEEYYSTLQLRKTITSYIEYLNIKNTILGDVNNLVQGVPTKLSDSKLKDCYKIMESYIETDEKTFIKIFSGKEFLLTKKIDWKVFHGGKPNQKALTAFLHLMFSHNDDLKPLLQRTEGEDWTGNIFSISINRSNYNKRPKGGVDWYQKLSHLLQTTN